LPLTAVTKRPDSDDATRRRGDESESSQSMVHRFIGTLDHRRRTRAAFRNRSACQRNCPAFFPRFHAEPAPLPSLPWPRLALGCISTYCLYDCTLYLFLFYRSTQSRPSYSIPTPTPTPTPTESQAKPLTGRRPGMQGAAHARSLWTGRAHITAPAPDPPCTHTRPRARA
jgi:hypothetical protein